MPQPTHHKHSVLPLLTHQVMGPDAAQRTWTHTASLQWTLYPHEARWL
jgi:hypothetical protein